MSKHSKSERDGTEDITIPAEGFVKFDPADGEQATLEGNFPDGVQLISLDGPEGIEALLNAVFGEQNKSGWSEVKDMNGDDEVPFAPATDVEILPASEADAISVFFGTKHDGTEELVFSFQKGKQQLLVAFDEATYSKFKAAEEKSVGLHAEEHGKRFGQEEV